MGKYSIVEIKHSGDFKRTTKFLNFLSNGNYIKDKLDEYGKKGVALLKAATPVDTGKTADSWDYKVSINDQRYLITWTNNNTIGHTSIVLLLQYGHATRGGGYVEGRDFINPAIQPLFDQMADDIWREVVNA